MTSTAEKPRRHLLGGLLRASLAGSTQISPHSRHVRSTALERRKRRRICEEYVTFEYRWTWLVQRCGPSRWSPMPNKDRNDCKLSMATGTE